MQKADLVVFPISLVSENTSITPEIEIMAAITPHLNSPALITPTVYDTLVKQAKLYQVSTDVSGEGERKDRVERSTGEDFSFPSVIDLPDVENEGEGTDRVEREPVQDNAVGNLSRLFRQQQKECITLQRCWGEGKIGKNNYVTEDGLLYYLNRKVNESGKLLVVPQCRRKEVMRLAHNINSAGHLGAVKTLERIRLSFYWEGVRKEVKQYCSACEECQMRRRVRTADRAPIKPVARPELPFQVVNADIIGPILPKSGRGHNYVLCVVDQHSRWPEAVPIRSLSAKTTCEAFLNIFMRMGVPQVIAMDNGTNFAAKLTAEFLNHLGAVPRFSTPAYPLSNGLVERWNGTIKNMLHHAIQNHGKDWDRILPFLLWASREITNETTGFSPFELVFGRTPTGPLALLKTCWEGETIIPEGLGPSPADYLENLRNKMNTTRKICREIAQNKQEDYVRRYNLRSSEKKFEIGDKVIVLIPDSTNKLCSKWMGPGTIVDKKGDHSFFVELPDGSVKHLHQNKLRAYIQSVATIGLVYEADEEFGEIQHSPEGGERENEVSFKEILEEKCDHLDRKKKLELGKILNEFKNMFMGPGKIAKVGRHVISLKPECERKQPHIYRVPEILKPAVESQVQELLERGLIEPSQAEIAYPLVCVAKKDTSIRLCVDYRALNKVTKINPFPMQNAAELRFKAGAAKYITTLDILKGYWTIPMDEQSKELTSFVSPKGQYQWTVMPYGLNGSANTFQKTMNTVLSKHQKYADSYIDDIIIFSQTWEEHLKHISAVLTNLKDLNFSVNFRKCHFSCGKVNYLGHVIGSGQHGPDPEKLKTIEGLKRPTNKKELRSVLGLFNYYREYVQNFAELAIPLTELTRKRVSNEIPWPMEAEEAFKKLKGELYNTVALHTPDIKKPFVISCDASDLGIGAALGQRDEKGKVIPITFASHKLTDTQKKWAAIEREAYALIWSLNKFETWIFGNTVFVYTDHNPLKYLVDCAPKNPKLQRWLLAIQRYDVVINYKPGIQNQDADALSRLATTAWEITHAESEA